MKKLSALLLCSLLGATSVFAQDGKKVLVAYFSATGTTENVAQLIVKAIGSNATLYEITPAQAYTSADLNWNDSKSRSTVEQRQNKSIRPAIAGNKIDMAQYDVVFIGFPIWWYEEPRIIDTFLESYDLSGKTIVPFSTSGGSGISGAETNMKKYQTKAKFLAGRNFAYGAKENDVKSWISGLKF